MVQRRAEESERERVAARHAKQIERQRVEREHRIDKGLPPYRTGKKLLHQPLCIHQKNSRSEQGGDAERKRMHAKSGCGEPGESGMQNMIVRVEPREENARKSTGNEAIEGKRLVDGDGEDGCSPNR